MSKFEDSYRNSQIGVEGLFCRQVTNSTHLLSASNNELENTKLGT